MSYEITENVKRIGEIAFEGSGNTIPDKWYSYLKNEKGKIQTSAALVLAEIVQWYRPCPIYDTNTKLISFSKRFEGDLPQIDYKYFNDKLGLTESQTRSALIFLEEKELIFREFRNIRTGRYTLNNVMYIGIHVQKILEISDLKTSNPADKTKNSFANLGSSCHLPNNASTSHPKEEKDWSSKFSIEQKEFLVYLLQIIPKVGDPIEKNHATWWIRTFGIEKIKTALQVYWQRVKKAESDPTVPMPNNIGKYVRKILNESVQPVSEEKAKEGISEKQSETQKKFEEVPKKSETGLSKSEKTNINDEYMPSMLLYEVNDRKKSLTFKKEKKKLAKVLRKSSQSPDWSLFFSEDEKKYLGYLIRIKPEKGEPIAEKHATWWIRNFGIEKIKIALQVYWQQVEKSKKNAGVPMPLSIGAYVREALNKGTQPCREEYRNNKNFAEQFKMEVGWNDLTITEKYCRFNEWGKEWYYYLPEPVFIEGLKSTFANYRSMIGM